MIEKKETSIGKRIKNRRVQLGLSREKLANMVNITPRFLFDIEIGKKGMSLETFYNIKAALNCSADWLLDGTMCSMTNEEIKEIENLVNKVRAVTCQIL